MPLNQKQHRKECRRATPRPTGLHYLASQLRLASKAQVSRMHAPEWNLDVARLQALHGNSEEQQHLLEPAELLDTCRSGKCSTSFSRIQNVNLYSRMQMTMRTHLCFDLGITFLRSIRCLPYVPPPEIT